jgi:flagellar biosynthesis protein FlhB
MSEQEDKDNQTEDPSQRKLEKAAEKGDVPRSQEVNTWFVLGGGTLAIMATSGQASSDLTVSLRGLIQNIHTVPFDRGGLSAYGSSVILGTLAALAAPLLLLILSGIAGSIVQNIPQITTEQVAPKLSRLSPLAGAKRMFGQEALVQFAKGLMKLAIIAGVMGAVLWPHRNRFESLITLNVSALMPAMRIEILLLLGGVMAAFTFVAAGDLLYQRLSWFKRQRMSKKEQKDEYKETEGSPEIKAKIHQLRQRNRKKRMMAQVPKATVVLMNPTHYAVALQYEKGMPAPICVAKGQDVLALRIRDLAQENRVPVVENAPLARALYKAVDLDQEIPIEHYKAVAEVIGYVLRLRGRAR